MTDTKGSVEFYPSTFTGYRWYKIVQNDEVILTPVTFHMTVRNAHKWQKFECYCSSDFPLRQTNIHTTVTASGNCGFYGYHDPVMLPEHGFTADCDYALAAVECKGAAVIGDQGFRVEKMRVLALDAHSVSYATPFFAYPNEEETITGASYKLETFYRPSNIRKYSLDNFPDVPILPFNELRKIVEKSQPI